MCRGLLHYPAGDGQTGSPWPAMPAALVPLCFPETDAAGPAAQAVLQCTGCSQGRHFGLSDLVKRMS